MELATFITAIAALAASVASFLVILEMKKQRMISVRPIIKIVPKSFVLEPGGVWYTSAGEQRRTELEIEFVNFGAGPAIDFLIKNTLQPTNLEKRISS